MKYWNIIIFLLLSSVKFAFSNGPIPGDFELTFNIIQSGSQSPKYEVLFHRNGKAIAKRVYQRGDLITGEGDIPSGAIIERYESGRIKNILIYRDGKRNGRAIGFYESGSLKKVVTFEDDQPVGTTKMYYENGTLMMIAKLEKGKQVSYKYFFPNGQLKEEVYNKHGKLIRRMFDSSGKPLK